MPIDLKDDYQVLAATLWGEARGEDEAGIEAVASVVVNRVKVAKVLHRKQFGDGSFVSCCLSPAQFSCWNPNDPNRSKMLSLDLEHPATQSLKTCLETADNALAGELPDQTGGALYYKVTGLPWPKDWGTEVPPTCQIGHHSFYVLEE